MKVLKERNEIAEALNFGKYPVLTMDTADVIKLGGEVCGFQGCKVKIEFRTYEGYENYTRGSLVWFGDSQIFTISEEPTILSNRFGYSDIINSVEYANAPKIEKNEDFVLVVYNSKTKQILKPMIISINDRVKIDLFELFGIQKPSFLK